MYECSALTYMAMRMTDRENAGIPIRLETGFHCA